MTELALLLHVRPVGADQFTSSVEYSVHYPTYIHTYHPRYMHTELS